MLLLTLAWAFAFTRIYNRTETRVAASHWIFQNVPGPVNLEGAQDHAWKQLVPLNGQVTVRPGSPYQTWFRSVAAGRARLDPAAAFVVVARTAENNNLRLRASIFTPDAPDDSPLVVSEIPLPASATFDNLPMRVGGLPSLLAGQRYGLKLELLSDAAVQSGVTPDELGAFIQVDGQVSLSLYARATSMQYQPQGAAGAVIRLPEGGMLRQVRLPAGVTVPAGTVYMLDAQSSDQQTAAASISGAQTGVPDENGLASASPGTRERAAPRPAAGRRTGGQLPGGVYPAGRRAG